MASAQEAEEFIQSLNGHVALRGNHIEHSAKRLLFEILRFINGRTFREASTANEHPFIIFKIYPDSIVIDCNHDDLSKADLKAICQPGDEDKVKGANFKSIITATKKVHVQSGNFSFDFQHNILDIHGDMMRPVWVTPRTDIPNNSSRITLYLHDQGSKEDVQSLKDVVVSQFERLREESVLFLQDLETMRVEFFDKDSTMYRSKEFRKCPVDAYRVSVVVSTGGEKSYTQLYHVTKQSAADLSMNFTLAFPLTAKFEVQADSGAMELFNFVSLQASPFRFIVHADFDFNEQNNIVPASAHNLAIVDRVATAFMEAMLQFCEHATLRYCWPLFLPSKPETFGSLWSGLGRDIKAWIARNPIIKSRNEKHWRLISHLMILSADGQDDAGNPVWNDSIVDPFISSKYPLAATSKLEEYGLVSLDSERLLGLLKFYFNDSRAQRRTVGPTKEWHETLARLINKFLSHKEVLETVKSLPLLRLKNGDLISAASGPLYFPTTGNFDIPESLGLQLVSDSANTGNYSKPLYQELGVLQASALQVRSLIMNKFSCPKNLSLCEIRNYLRYLYLTHRSYDSPCTHPYQTVCIMTAKMKVEEPWRTIVYLTGHHHPYAPETLLGCGMFGFSGNVNFLHPDILKNGPEQPSASHPSWKDWLCHGLGIRERLSLLRPKTLCEQQSSGDTRSSIGNSEGLSEELRYVFKSRPHLFLGLVKYLWEFDGPRLLNSPELVSELQGLPAQRLCAGNCSLNLRDTWIPLKALQDSVSYYMGSSDEFPFLKLGWEKSIDLDTVAKWSFLTDHFGVKQEMDMCFLLEILSSIKRSCHVLSSWQTEKVIELYASIVARLKLSIGDEKEQALNFFKDGGILCIDEERPSWTDLLSCRRMASANMLTARSPKSSQGETRAKQQRMNYLSEIFQLQICLGNVSAKDLVEGLLVLRNEGCEDVARVAEIYKYLDNNLFDSSEIRIAFEECAVILVKRDDCSTWLSTSQCFWSEADATPLNSSVKNCYPDLKEFFLKKVGVNVSAYDRLIDSNEAHNGNTESLLLSLMDETRGLVFEFPMEPMLKAKVFPIDGPIGMHRKLCSIDTDFAIGDREHLRNALRFDIKMLDLDLRKVRRLQPLFRWLSIEDRYLSRRVEEKLEQVASLHRRRWKLASKAYQIARVGATFNSYGSSHDALSLYHRLRTVEIIEVTYIFVAYEVIQDGQVIRSHCKHNTSNWISDEDNELIIYVSRDTDNQQLNLVSALPRRLQEWLMKDTHKSTNSDALEVTNALNSIFAASGSALDSILRDEGIVELPFKNMKIDQFENMEANPFGRREADQRKAKIRVRLPGMDEAVFVTWMRGNSCF